ncbi:TPA: AraC family transcriptional regulator [Serratia marcescens]|nr:AraC family transcriptional regulator [Serratia marcescens]
MIFQREVLSGVVDYIEGNITGDLSIDNVSAISGYSRWHLQRLFKEYYGIKLGTYIRCRRLSQSSILLKLTRVKILDIAIAYGFQSQQCYTRAFKKIIGMSPNEFRQSTEWDFSKHIHSFKSNKTVYFQLDLSGGNEGLFEKYKKIVCRSFGNNRRRGKNPIALNANLRGGRWGIVSHRIQSSLHKVWERSLTKFPSNYYFPMGKYMVIPFHGSNDEYAVFYKEIYDYHLPVMNAVMEREFIIELHKSDVFDNDGVYMDIIIPIVSLTKLDEVRCFM